MKMKFSKWLVLVCVLSATTVARAFDYEGHRVVNQLALASLPKEFPAFVQTAAAKERIAFLSGEPDRWRNSPEQSFRHINAPDHFLDLEELDDFKLTPQTVSRFRYEFLAQMTAYRIAHPNEFPAVDPEKNQDRTRGLPGFLPWAINEHYGKLKSAFTYLKTLEELGTPEEIANARENAIYIMGVMGHYVGDGAQPLHTTKHFNGWVGENPNGYTTNRTFHSWIDGGFFQATGGIEFAKLTSRLRTAKMMWEGDAKAKHDDVFPEAMGYLQEQFKLVEPLYALDKTGKLSPRGDTAEGRAFMEKQLIVAAQMLGDLWLNAWQQAGTDTFLKAQLIKRQTGKKEK